MRESKSTFSKGIRLGVISIIIFAAALILWMLLIEVKSASFVTGKLIFEGQNKKVQHLTGGKIAKILVREGDEVKKGQILVVLDNTESKIEKNRLTNDQFFFNAVQKRLDAQIQKISELSFEEIAEEDLDREKSEVIANQILLFHANEQYLKSQLGVLNDKILKLKNNIESSEKRLQNISAQLDLLKMEEKELLKLIEKQLISKPRLWGTQREIERVKEQIIQQQGLILTAEQEILEASEQKQVLTKEAYKKDLQDIAAGQEKLIDVESRLAKTKYILGNGLITAPISGIVMDLSIHTDDGVIKAGDDLMTIVPKTDKILVQGELNPLDLKNIALGEKAFITLMPYNQSYLPPIEGSVAYLAPDSYYDEQLKKNYYRIYIEFPKEQLEKYPEVKIYPGMPVEAKIINRMGTFFEYLVTPLRRSFDRAFREL